MFGKQCCCETAHSVSHRGLFLHPRVSVSCTLAADVACYCSLSAHTLSFVVKSISCNHRLHITMDDMREHEKRTQIKAGGGLQCR